MLRALAAGPDGLSTPAVSAASGERAQPRQQALTRTGTVLRKLERQGLAERCGVIAEPGTYHNIRSVRWRITPAGRQALAVPPPAVPPPARRAPPSWDQMDAAARRGMVSRRYAAGQSTTRIGTVLRVSPETIRRALQDAGVTLRPGRRPSSGLGLPAAEVIARYQAGDSLITLASGYGVTRHAIEAVLAGARVPRRGYSAAGRARTGREAYEASP